MKPTLVRYQTLPERASENEALIRGVFDELRRLVPPGFRYGAFKLADGVSFVHVAMTDAAAEPNPLVGLESFRRFQADLSARCVELPVVTQLTQVDSYGLGPIHP